MKIYNRQKDANLPLEHLLYTFILCSNFLILFPEIDVVLIPK